MSKKTQIIVSTIITTVAGAAIGLVTLFHPTGASLINSAIDIVSGAAITIVGLFGPDIAESIKSSFKK